MTQAIAHPDYQAAEQILERFERFGVDLGLDRIHRLLEDLGRPQERFPIIHVAGSNGKGSVCACLSAMLQAAGYRVGRHTSPHLVSWCERICINDVPISPSDLRNVLQQVTAAIALDYPSPTQFEVITAAAWLYLADQAVDIAVIEVGLGGRLDATNVCDRPLVTVITSLSMEHWQRLGPTLPDIAREKAGIFKPSCPAVIGPLPSDAQPVVVQRAQQVDCPVIQVEPSLALEEDLLYTTPSALLSPATVPQLCYRLSLPGAHQYSNSAVAIAALQVLQQQGWQISTSAMVEGLGRAHWPARLQWWQWQGHPVLVDGAHNPSGAQALRQFVDQSLEKGDRLANGIHWPIHWVMGLLSNKDHADIFTALLRPGDRLWLVPVPGHGSAQPEELVVLARQCCPQLAYCQPCPAPLQGLEEAIAASRQWVAQTPDPSAPEQESPPSGPPTVILCGSLYLIGSVLQQTQRTV